MRKKIKYKDLADINPSEIHAGDIFEIEDEPKELKTVEEISDNFLRVLDYHIGKRNLIPGEILSFNGEVRQIKNEKF